MKHINIRQYPEPSGLLSTDIHPVLNRIYLNRAVTDISEIEYQLPNLLPFHSLKDIDQAVEVICGVIKAQGKILIVGDFDADGATSTAVAIRLLNAFGCQHVDYLVPNRFDFGYGLTPEIVQVAAGKAPDLIITVDNGIASLDGVALANQLGMPVVVTDHHLAAEVLPDAAAIVNPNQPDCPFPSKMLAGVGVIFYVMMAVRAALREQGWFDQIQEPNLASVLDLVALGTVADVVPLDKNNRILVEQGLKRIRAGLCCPGIDAILKQAGKDPSKTTASDMGFIIGPRLNAAGRLEDMSLGIECLISDDEMKVKVIAEELNNLNQERRSIEQDMLDQALQILSSLEASYQQADIPSAISLYDDFWHQGVIGILASRIKDRYHRPVIAFADAGNGEIKGSARSIKGLHIRDALDLVDKRNPGLIRKFGGHAMAAGLTIRQDQFEQFKSSFEQIAGSMLSQDDLQDVIHTDGALAAQDFNMQLAELIKYAEPWGQGFPEPMFNNVFTVTEWRIVGQKHLKMKLQPEQSDLTIDAIAFNTTEEQLGSNTDRIMAVYKLDVNIFRNNKSLQLLVDYLEPA